MSVKESLIERYKSGGGTDTEVMKSTSILVKEVWGNEGAPAEIRLQAKINIDPTNESQTITPDSGYHGLSSVQINAIPESGSGGSGIEYGTFDAYFEGDHSLSTGLVSIVPYKTTGYEDYYPALVGGVALGSGSTARRCTGRWYIAEDGYMYVTFWGNNSTYTPLVTATMGEATFVMEKLASNAFYAQYGHTTHALRVYKISPGAVVRVSYFNNS